MGGVIIPASKYYCKNDLLWFSGGDRLFLFNNDKRGCDPNDEGKENKDLSDVCSSHTRNKIHPCYYSFEYHAPEYLIELPTDDCDCPDLKKISPPSSLAICCKDIQKNGIFVEVMRDGRPTFLGKITPGQINFDGIDFSGIIGTANQGNLHMVREGGGAFYTKQIILRTKEYFSPFGVKHLSFR